ncbi:hypothetical protein C8R44DRAFT_883059 [Mycena epipterygia]|nr:hypothetical protein C8R44DRAFT_883059 [Mycena epipterygia]
MSGLDTILGALLIGTWADSLLYCVEILQAVYYFRHFKNDSWMLKLVVLSAITIDTVSMLGTYATVYLVLHDNSLGHVFSLDSPLSLTYVAGDTSFLMIQYWPVILFPLTTGIVSALVQSFLAVRYWRLVPLFNQNLYITPILFCCILIALAGSFASVITIAMFPTYKDRNKAKIPVTGKKWSGNETSSGGISGTRAQPGSRARSDGGIHVQVHIDNRQDFSTGSFLFTLPNGDANDLQSLALTLAPART